MFFVIQNAKFKVADFGDIALFERTQSHLVEYVKTNAKC